MSNLGFFYCFPHISVGFLIDITSVVLKWLPWSWIHIRNGNRDSGLWKVKMASRKEENLRFQVEKSIDHCAYVPIVFA